MLQFGEATMNCKPGWAGLSCRW